MDKSEEVAAWLRDRLGCERRLQSELISDAWADGIDLKFWAKSPVVKATGFRPIWCEAWEGQWEWHFTLEKGDDDGR